jgi:hypothetical protein
MAQLRRKHGRGAIGRIDSHDFDAPVVTSAIRSTDQPRMPLAVPFDGEAAHTQDIIQMIAHANAATLSAAEVY